MTHKASFVLLAALSVAACSRAPETPVADFVILDADIVTMNPRQPQARALAVRDGKVAFLGNEAQAQSWIGEKTQVIRAAGASVWPGLIDSHIHLMEGALSLDACSADDAQLPLEKVAPLVRDCAARSPGDGWVVVQNLNAAGFEAHRKALDAILPDRPLLLWGADGHVGWTNTAGLQRVGIDRNTANPPGGRIERARDGEPTGFLVDNALNLVTDRLEKPTPEKREELLLRALRDVAGAGITTFLEANTSEATVRTYVSLAEKKQLAARVTFALGSRGENTDAEFARLNELRKLAESQPRLRADIIKLFEDGVIEYPTQTAALLEPYLEANGKPGKNLGPLYHEPEPLEAFVNRAAAEGYGVHIHVIGDRAARVALDAFADARAKGSKRSYSLAHLELVDPADIPRFRELDVIASMQLQWGQPDNYSVDAVLPYIGPERQGRLYPAASLLAGGATIAGGSDWNVSTFNPFEAMAVAISRKNPKEPQRGTLAPDQAVKLKDVLPAYTVNAARMMGREQEVGTLEVGKAADVIVLDRHLDESSSSDDILATKVKYTFIDGAMVNGPAGS